MPLFHAHGLISITVFTLSAGGTIVPSPADPRELVSRAARYRPTCFSAAPTIHQGLLRHAQSNVVEFGSLRFARSSSAPLPYAIFDDLEALYGCLLIETYGLTESTSVVVSNDLDHRRKGSVGRIIGQTEARVLTNTGQKISGRGELLLRGPSLVMNYLDRTNPAPAEDWFHTGDLADIDAEGHIRIIGRLKELVKRGGYGVSPTEVDNALCEIKGVKAACTFSVPHRTLAEELVCVVEADEDIGERTIIEALLARLATYKVPSAVRIVDGIPRNQIGKIVRNDVRKRYLSLFLAPFEDPATPEEAELLRSWKGHLRIECIGVLDNLILAGIDPLLVSTVKEDFFGHSLSVPFLLKYPTIRAQSELIRRGAAE